MARRRTDATRRACAMLHWPSRRRPKRAGSGYCSRQAKQGSASVTADAHSPWRFACAEVSAMFCSLQAGAQRIRAALATARWRNRRGGRLTTGTSTRPRLDLRSGGDGCAPRFDRGIRQTGQQSLELRVVAQQLTASDDQSVDLVGIESEAGGDLIQEATQPSCGPVKFWSICGTHSAYSRPSSRPTEARDSSKPRRAATYCRQQLDLVQLSGLVAHG